MMSSNSANKSNPEEGVVLEPNQKLPLLITVFGISLGTLNSWTSIAITIFGVFLLIQSFTLRLKFTNNEMIVLQLGRELRRFPYKHWIAWKLLLPWLPGLLYFREEASPHLLPILFNPISLQNQLKLRVGDMEITKNNS